MSKGEDTDALFRYDKEKQQAILHEKPWKSDVHFFKRAHMNALALLKIIMHARRGGHLEVMGVMQGKINAEDRSFIIMDCFALPVEGTETRVSAGNEAVEYMAQYLDTIRRVGREENLVGWYHSHPGYGCWLSGIDVGTQQINQKYQDPFLAVVVDPVRTMAAGKVEIGAFRTYPEGYKADDSPSEYQSIPSHKIEDFGVHCKSYYQIDLSYFKSSLDSKLLDLLWNKYWVNTLSASPLLSSQDYTTGNILDIAEKMEKAEGELGHSRMLGMGGMGGDSKGKKGGSEQSQLSKITQDSAKAGISVLQGLMTQTMKNALFNY